MGTTLKLGSVTVDVVKKDIKNVHLSVYPPEGKVRISAPLRMSTENIRLFAISKLQWIRLQQKKIVDQERETAREYSERESHYLWGKRYLLDVVEVDGPPRIEIRHRRIVIQIRPSSSTDRKRELIEEWYRAQLRAAVQPLISKWEKAMGVKVDKVFVRRMKTKWGSCSRASVSIRFNTDLAKKPPECLEYIVVHELAHLIEPTHNDRFTALLDQMMPNWRLYRKLLNQLPVRHENWSY
ncbi:MAG TPA: SprT family zinc-dependent metalloprotease [Edaphobacter sp.]|uniref:M48 family metallopeptidase n=1 Tax=Edaphobacter sp. TaxID=1934404 RepID=UPI002CB04E9D|nr:SprT family zinc-dependent metalloprotease [Edaphobacter sp.]HUZ95036.1 SprT family zinc-dependent metalloprotease [Edaphobacter sp.]